MISISELVRPYVNNINDSIDSNRNVSRQNRNSWNNINKTSPHRDWSNRSTSNVNLIKQQFNQTYTDFDIKVRKKKNSNKIRRNIVTDNQIKLLPGQSPDGRNNWEGIEVSEKQQQTNTSRPMTTTRCLRVRLTTSSTKPRLSGTISTLYEWSWCLPPEILAISVPMRSRQLVDCLAQSDSRAGHLLTEHSKTQTSTGVSSKWFIVVIQKHSSALDIRSKIKLSPHRDSRWRQKGRYY